MGIDRDPIPELGSGKFRPAPVTSGISDAARGPWLHESKGCHKWLFRKLLTKQSSPQKLGYSMDYPIAYPVQKLFVQKLQMIQPVYLFSVS